jgi:hypothetical protein
MSFLKKTTANNNKQQQATQIRQEKLKSWVFSANSKK